MSNIRSVLVNMMKNFNPSVKACIGILLFITTNFACNQNKEESQSDRKALKIADQVIEACGGQTNWENTRYVTWRNFGKRLNVWDKHTGDIRVENTMTLVLMNVNTGKGRVWKYDTEVKDPDDVQRFLDFGLQAWKYDSYEVFLPFLLKEKGVVLRYIGEGEVEGAPADILQVTFDDVGPTPKGKYHVYIDKETKLLVQWDYYMDVEDELPRVQLPWLNYQKYGNIFLSADRGKKKHTKLGVFDDLPESILTSPDHVSFPDPTLN